MATPVVVMGLGEIGQQLVRALVTRPDLELVGVLDKSPERIGRSLFDLVPFAVPDLVVESEPDAALARGRGGVLIHCTGSRLAAVAEELERCLQSGMHVVSTCEELAFPWIRQPQLADRLEAVANRCGVALLGAGVNPGFVMDRLPALLATVTGRVSRVVVRRSVDAARRRLALQRKVGVGLTAAEFSLGVEAGTLGNVGLMESAALLAVGLGEPIDSVTEDVSPVIAARELRSALGPVPVGSVAGVRQVAVAESGGHELVRLELTMALDVAAPVDEIRIDAEPPLELRIPGGIPGDAATAWSVVHAAEILASAKVTGLLTPMDLPLAR